MEIKLLDCTLRDGGYVNNWNFGYSTIICIFERLVSANIDAIEVGFLDERVDFNLDHTIVPNTDGFDKIFKNVDKKNSLVFAMIDYGTCGINNIAPRKETFIDGIRIIFKLKDMHGALEFAQQVKDKGYLVSLQLVSITSYSDRDVLDLIDLANSLKPYAVSIVDTYGLLHKEETLHYFDLLNKNLSRDIIIGYHSHNNFQLAYANTVELIKTNPNRIIMVDGTAYGMGKSAGNAPLELLAMYLNENYNGNYDINQILEAIDNSVMRFYKEQYWGYSLMYFLAALNDCHPKYITYLLNKKTLSIKSINEIVNKIDQDKKLSYNESHIEQIYTYYQEHFINDDEHQHSLKKVMMGRTILILAPGKSLITEFSKIQNYIQSTRPVVVSVNTVPDGYNIDFVFISNSKRYGMLFEQLHNYKNNFNVIATSNITSANGDFDYVLDYSKLLDENPVIADNSAIMFLRFLSNIGIRNIVFAGFDGFSTDNDNYYDKNLDFKSDSNYLHSVNMAIKQRIADLSRKIYISFLTPSLYEVE